MAPPLGKEDRKTFGKRLAVLLVCLAFMVLTACGGASEESRTPEEGSTPKVIEGTFDVGDYKLYMRCEGSGSPTVAYLHSFIEEGSGGARPHNGRLICEPRLQGWCAKPSVLSDPTRVPCRR